MSNLTIVSAPGKVLLTGGYLILDRKYNGIVVGTSARFYTVIFSGNNGKISVHSPQFIDGEWEYRPSLKSFYNDEGFFSCELESTNPERHNSFVEIAIKYSLLIISRRKNEQQFKEIVTKGLEIYIVGDNDFYSQREQLRKLNLPLTLSSLKSLEPFCKVHCTLKKVNKTGLGSSAALITSLVSALFVHFEIVSNKINEITNNDRKLIHNIAQFCHCLAQGKVGSGFDVSAAVWGNHEVIGIKNFTIKFMICEKNKLISACSLTRWDNQVTSFSLPHGFKLILADIDAGSHTPSMVGKVLKWRKENSDQANTLWDTLTSHNTTVSNNLRELTKNHEQDEELYLNAIKICESWALLAEQNPNNNNKIRELLREMSELSRVPIEPPKQTKLLDACNEIPGIIMAGVPGAGGYDAIFCIGLGNTFSSQIEKLWNSWEEMSVGPLLSRESSKGYMIEQINNIPGLSECLNL
ncbi:1925_t:CDS:2 [Rhizophagus irregularis]|nr:1925_t:CDS:2 [Rhizophagus irregularis]